MASPFPNFAALPPELRAMIWELCLPSRVIRLSRLSLTTTRTKKPPLIAHVCRESRALALAHHRRNNAGL